jgi:hypothetical protein
VPCGCGSSDVILSAVKDQVFTAGFSEYLILRCAQDDIGDGTPRLALEGWDLG